jgi:hypothetical protein
LVSGLDQKIASISAQLASLQVHLAPDSNWTLATDSGKLLTTVSVQVPELTVTGRLSVGLLTFDDLAADISSLTGLLSLNHGVVTINETGDMVVAGSITAKKYHVDTSDVLAASVGKAEIPAGLTEILIDTTAVATSSSIFITPEGEPIPVAAEATESGRFVVRIPTPLPQALKVNWWVIN